MAEVDRPEALSGSMYEESCFLFIGSRPHGLRVIQGGLKIRSRGSSRRIESRLQRVPGAPERVPSRRAPFLVFILRRVGLLMRECFPREWSQLSDLLVIGEPFEMYKTESDISQRR
jgi:hypothetical protein